MIGGFAEVEIAGFFGRWTCRVSLRKQFRYMLLIHFDNVTTNEEQEIEVLRINELIINGVISNTYFILFDDDETLQLLNLMVLPGS
jgi:hypothetical protein